MTTRTPLGELARRITPTTASERLLMPDARKAALRHLRDALRSKPQTGPGTRKTGALGVGLTTLFTGADAAGKAQAAEVLASDLGASIYRVDLAAVASKYVGETEKNLRRLFEAAEASGAVLFFDEADALFGKRSDVKDSHDRYANLEVGYLLQQLETFRRLAIVATNRREALDEAFTRRMRFVVDFPPPAA